MGTAWKNGPSGAEFSTDPQLPKYGTHDWLAEHALDFLDDNEKQYILANLATFLYGTELPDKTTGKDAIGDLENQHFYFNESGVIKDDSSGRRASEEFALAEAYLENGDIYNGTLHLGVMTHYIADLAVFGNVMNATYWGEPSHYVDYMDYVNSKMTSYTSEFNSYLTYITGLGLSYPNDAAQLVARNTTFNPNGYRNCTWMDDNYDWLSSPFKDRCGESLNLVVNALSALLHNFYKFNLTTPSQPQGLMIESVSGHTLNLTWSANPEKNVAGYSIFINKTASSTKFESEPIANMTFGTSYTVRNLNSETTYYFKLLAYSIIGKKSQYSDIVYAATLDVTPPAVPSIRELPEITNKPKLLIFGFAEPNSTVEVYLNNNFSQPVGIATSGPILGEYRVEITLSEGENNITSRALDASGNPSDFAMYRIVILDTVPPVADAGADIEISKRESPVMVRFDGANSTDNQGIITNYTWTVDLKNKYVALYGVSPIYFFDRAGEFNVNLNVTDKISNWANDSITVKVVQLDYQAPYITTRFPEYNASNQSINITIIATINEPLNVSTISIKLISNIEGEIQIPRPNYDPLKRLLTLRPFANLTHDRAYTVIITASDLAGNPLIGGTWNFTTAPRPEDFDGDNIPDSWEDEYGLDPDNAQDAIADPDNDGLSNINEYNNGDNSTNPTNPDTDSDGMTDLFECKYKLNPLDPSDRNEDFDADGKTNYEEYLGKDGAPGNFDWTDPNVSDKSDKSEEPDEDDYYWVIIIIVIILVIILILILLLRKIKYKQTGEYIKDDDGYLKTRDARDLGIGGNIILEDPHQYLIGGKTIKPEFRRSYDMVKGTAGLEAVSDSDLVVPRPTPAEILEKARSEEKKCPKCGAGLPEDTTYCFECGTMLD